MPVVSLIVWVLPIKAHSNVHKWRYYLADYFNKHLSDLIEFGFPLDFDIMEANHPLDIQHAERINQYIQEKLPLMQLCVLLCPLHLINIFHLF